MIVQLIEVLDLNSVLNEYTPTTSSGTYAFYNIRQDIESGLTMASLTQIINSLSNLQYDPACKGVLERITDFRTAYHTAWELCLIYEMSGCPSNHDITLRRLHAELEAAFSEVDITDEILVSATLTSGQIYPHPAIRPLINKVDKSPSNDRVVLKAVGVIKKHEDGLSFCVGGKCWKQMDEGIKQIYDNDLIAMDRVLASSRIVNSYEGIYECALGECVVRYGGSGIAVTTPHQTHRFSNAAEFLEWAKQTTLLIQRPDVERRYVSIALLHECGVVELDNVHVYPVGGAKIYVVEDMKHPYLSAWFNGYKSFEIASGSVDKVIESVYHDFNLDIAPEVQHKIDELVEERDNVSKPSTSQSDEMTDLLTKYYVSNV